MKEQLQRIGVECPVTHYDPRRPLLRHALVDIDTLERLVATLAERVYEAERVPCHASRYSADDEGDYKSCQLKEGHNGPHEYL